MKKFFKWNILLVIVFSLFAGNSFVEKASALPPSEPTVVSAKFTGSNEITIVYSEAVTGETTDYTDFRINGENDPRNITNLSGNETDTTILTFDGAAAPTNSYGTIDINNPPRSVKSMVGDLLEVAPLDNQWVTSDGNIYVDATYFDADNDGGHDWGVDAFSTIADGISAATIDGTVYVFDGNYSEILTISQPMKIIGQSNTGTIVTAPFGNNIFDVNANNVTISGFEITGANGGGSAAAGKAGISVNTSNGGVDGITISGNSFTTNRHAIKTQGIITNLNIENNTFSGSLAYNMYINKVNGFQTDVSTWSINNNNFGSGASGNFYSVNSNRVLDAQDNYWGTDVKGDISSSIFVAAGDGIDFVPFYTDVDRTILSDLYYNFNVCADVCDYATIQNAVDAADYEASTTGTSNIINVSAGNYGPVSITKPVTLMGPNAGVSPITGERASEAILDGQMPLIQMTTDGVANVTINGFKLVGTTVSAVAGVINSNKLNAHNVTIRDNIFSGSEGRAIFTTQGGADVYRNNWFITENIIENMSTSTNPFQAGMMVNSIQSSSITNNQISTTSYGGIQIGYASSTVISDNNITDVPRSGIQVGHSNAITIENNIITNAGTYQEVMPDARGFGVHTDDISENGGITIYNADQTNLTITGNTISNSWNGIAIRDDQSLGAALGLGNLVNENSITGSIHYAVENLSTGDDLSAEHNYWGSASPSFNTLMYGGVDYSPWWTTASGPDVIISSNKAITGFTIPSQVGTTTINETAHTISVIVPNGTVITALVPTITISGNSVSPSSGVAQDFSDDITYTVTATNESTQGYTVSVTVLSSTQTAPDDSGDVTLGASTPNAVIKNPSQEVTVNVESGATDPSIDLGEFISGGTGDIPKMTITVASLSNATIAIPATTVTSADAGWNGVLAAPTITTVTLPETSGQTKALSTAIEIGYATAKLSFDNGVRILFPNMAGKRIGYVRTGSSFTEITAACSADNQVTGDALGVDGDCKIDVGSDLVIWTRHFTSFAVYTQTTNAVASSGGGIAGSGPSSLGYVRTYPATVVAAKPISEMTPAELQVEIVRLTTLLKSLQAQLGMPYGGGYNFTNNLFWGAKSDEVKELQKILNSDPETAVAVSGVGSTGNETTFFGIGTKSAVIKFQKKYGIAPAVGYVGLITRAKLNELYK